MKNYEKVNAFQYDSSLEIPILYRDNDFIFVNKPSGVPVHRSKECSDAETLVQILKKQLGIALFPVHRLDRGVSGVIGFGLSSGGARKLQELLQKETTQKTYVALVRGKLDGAFMVNKALKNEKNISQEALSEFKAIASCSYCSIVMVRIYTGRRHQIRRHLSFLAHQVLGDRSYGKGRLNDFYRDNYQLNRIFLHSFNTHILSDPNLNEWVETLCVRAPLPHELKHVLDKLVAEGLFDQSAVNLID